MDKDPRDAALMRQLIKSRLAATGWDTEIEAAVWKQPDIQHAISEFSNALADYREQVGGLNLSDHVGEVLPDGERDTPPDYLPGVLEDCAGQVVFTVMAQLSVRASEMRKEISRLRRQVTERATTVDISNAEALPSVNNQTLSDRLAIRARLDAQRYRDKPASRHEKACARAQAALLTWHLNQDNPGWGFQASVLPKDETGKLVPLGAREAWRLLTSPLWKVLSLKDFQRLGLSPLTARGGLIPRAQMQTSANRIDDLLDKPVYSFAEVVGKRDGGGVYRFEVEIEIPEAMGGGTVRHYVERNAISYTCVGDYDFNSRAAFDVPQSFQLLPGGHHPAVVPRAYIGRKQACIDGFFDFIHESSITGAAISACGAIQTTHPWETWGLLHFLMTKYLPRCPVILAQHTFHFDLFGVEKFNADGVSALVVQPWVRAEALAEFWRQVQGRTQQGRGRNGSLPSEHHLAIFRFALEATTGNSLEWKTLSAKWGDKTGERLEANTMLQIFKRVREALFPHFSSEWG